MIDDLVYEPEKRAKCNKGIAVKLQRPTQSMLQIMTSWVDDEQSLRIWAGPIIRYPFTLESFTEDLNLETRSSYCVISSDDKCGPEKQGELLAFGQFYTRLERCHLACLVVAPAHRGKGVVKYLVKSLSEIGRQELELGEDSLFVLPDNEIAIRVYKSVGFKVVEYPEQLPIDECLYMIRC